MTHSLHIDGEGQSLAPVDDASPRGASIDEETPGIP
jgi:hypothetical protein